MIRIEATQPSDATAGNIYPIQFLQAGNLPDVPTPLVRVSTCGGLQLEVLSEVVNISSPQGRYTPVTLQQRPKGSSTALTLLKILTSLPGHYVSKDWLSEHLSPTRSNKDDADMLGERGLVRVDNVVGLLRGLLCPAGIAEAETLRKVLVAYVKNHQESGPGYRLAPGPLVWLDVDIIEASVKQACLLEQNGQDALPSWEHAYTLAARGSFLLDESYSDWVTDKRIEVDGYLRQAVSALHRLLIIRYGEAGENRVMLLLRRYWQMHPTDEEVLRPLMELLYKHDGMQEARESYQCLCQRLEQEGRRPDPRTQEIAQNLRHIGHSPYGYGTLSHKAESAYSVHSQNEIGTPFSRDIVSAIIKAVSESEEEKNQNMDPLRRTITAGLLSLASGTTPSLEWWERLVHPHPSAMNTEAFMSIQQLLETGWELSNAGELHIAEHVVLSFLPRIKQLVPYKQEAASIAAEGLRLHGILAAHQQRLGDKLAICLQAVEYSRQAENLDILVAQLSELAIAFIYARQPSNAFRTYQEALSYCEKKQVSPLVRSRVYAAAAPTYAKNGYIKEACSFIQKAYDGFPTHLNSEPNTFSADNKHFMIDYYQGLLFLVVNQPEEAYKAFEKAVIYPTESQMPERWRLIILNYQGLASILSNQLEQYAKCLEEGVSCSITLGSKKRYDEAINIFQQHLPQKWLTEPRIKQISERFQLERQSRRKEELEI